MPEHVGRWEKVSDAALTRAMPPRTLEQALEGDCPLVFVLSVVDAAGKAGWVVRLSTRDDREAVHLRAEDAMAAADRFLAKVERIAASTLAAEAGLDPSDWAFEMSTVGGRPAFRRRADPTCSIQKAEGGYVIVKGGQHTRMRFADPASAARVVAPPRPRHPAPRVRQAEDEAGLRAVLPDQYEARVTSVAPIAPDEPALEACEEDADVRLTHLALLSQVGDDMAPERRAPLQEDDADLLSVGDRVLMRLGDADADGARPVLELTVAPPQPTPSP